MKDEHQVRIEALKLTQTVGGITNIETRIKFASQIEAYILNGYSGEAKPPPPAGAVPGTEGKDPPARATKKAKRGSGKTGEASDPDDEIDIDPDQLLGRPSSRVAGVSV